MVHLSLRHLSSLVFFFCFFVLLPLSSSQPHHSSENDGTPLSYDSSPITSISRSMYTPSISPTPMLPPSSPPFSNKTMAKAVGVTAAGTLVLAGVFFFLFQRCSAALRREKIDSSPSFRREETVVVVAKEELKQRGGKVKRVTVDDNGQGFLYLKKLESGQLIGNNFSKVVINQKEEEKRVDNGGIGFKISTAIHDNPLFYKPSKARANDKVARPRSQASILLPSISKSPLLPVAAPPPTQPSPPPPPPPSPAIPMMKIPAPPPPPPPPLSPHPLPLVPAKEIAPPPPPPQVLAKKIPAPPPPPPMVVKRNPTPSPPPPKAVTLNSPLKPPPEPRRKKTSTSKAEESTEDGLRGTDAGQIQMKLKPLHWDKVIANVDHSMVWDEINDGSFRFDDDLMETLFGYTGTNQKSPEKNNIPLSSNNSNSTLPAQIFILEPRKSQNTAIVLRSLAVSRKEILDALIDGQGLSTETLEKLTKIAPSPEEASKILQFTGIPSKLADAESFLYHILKAVPSAFTRFNAMLFRSNYDPEILHFKESLQTLELGCKELRTRGIFLKLLEAILKAGNRMNAGTARGNAQGFNLNALRKLSDVKSSDGKTTLLQFVVEQVIRSEGKHCMINRNHSLGRSNNQRNHNSDQSSDCLKTQEEKEKEYLMLGLPVLGGLSTDFFSVKKAATIDYDSFNAACSCLAAKVAEIKQLVARCGNGEKGGFVKEMKGFLEECEEELKVVREEQTRVMELVKRTTEYYQAGSSTKEKGTSPLQLFVIVKDFLDMVDQACIEITKKLQRRNVRTSVGLSPPTSGVGGLSPPSSPLAARFQNLQSYFMPDGSRTTSSSDSDDDF